MEFQEFWDSLTDDEKSECARRWESQIPGTCSGAYMFNPAWPVSGEIDYEFPDRDFDPVESFDVMLEANYVQDENGECCVCGWFSYDAWHSLIDYEGRVCAECHEEYKTEEDD